MMKTSQSSSQFTQIVNMANQPSRPSANTQQWNVFNFDIQKLEQISDMRQTNIKGIFNERKIIL